MLPLFSIVSVLNKKSTTQSPGSEHLHFVQLDLPHLDSRKGEPPHNPPLHFSSLYTVCT